MTAAQTTQHPDYPRVRDAAHLAPHEIPGPIGDFLKRELIAWCDNGWRFDANGWGPAIADDLLARHHARTLGKTHP